MGIEDVELFAYEKWFGATYADNGVVYDVVFIRSYLHDIGYESRELANVLLDGKTVEGDDSLWQKIKDELEKLDLERGDEELQILNL